MKFKGILAIILLYWCACFAMFSARGSFFYFMMGWNVFLAALPLLFIQYASKAVDKSKRIQAVLFILLWLFFLPNAPYMVTDFIHVAGDHFKTLITLSDTYPQRSSIVYSNDILIWLKLLLIGFGCVFSALVGMESLYVFGQTLKRRLRTPIVLLFLTAAILLSSIGVYIGRFLRFNSWDILTNPGRLINQTVMQLNRFSLQFILAFSAYTLGCYIIYHLLKGTPKPQIEAYKDTNTDSHKEAIQKPSQS